MKEITEAPRYTVLIPTWNNLPFLKLCVQSIERHSSLPHEIVIHVNDGSDGTLEWVRQRGYRYRHSPENIGVCWALNGLRPLVDAPYMVYFNDDMYALPGWDTALFEEIEKMPDDKWFLSATMIQPYACNAHQCGPVADYGRGPEDFREQELLDEYSSLAIPDWKGATWPPNIVPRDIWDLVGGYSIEFSPGMASDPDFTAKLWLAGVREFRGVGRSLVYHFISKSVNRIVKNDGPIQFLRKWGITIRAFHEHLMRLGKPVSEPAPNVDAVLRTELWRSRVKRLYTIGRDMHTATLWQHILPRKNK